MQSSLVFLRQALLTAALAAALAAQTPPPAQPAPPAAQPGTDKPAPAKSADPKAPAQPGAKPTAKPGATPAKPAPKKDEPEPKIPGTVIPRGNGSFLGLALAGGNFKLSFYDAKKKPMPIDITRATARWPNIQGPGDNRAVLNPGGDGQSLVGNKPVRPPYTFKVYLTLLSGEGDDTHAVESYVVDFRG